MMSFVLGHVSRYDSNVTDSDKDSEDGDKEGSPKPVKKKPPVSVGDCCTHPLYLVCLLQSSDVLTNLRQCFPAICCA